jgi:hypothetical protein
MNQTLHTLDALQVLHAAALPLADLPNPTPAAPPGEVAGMVTTLLAFAKWFGLIAGVGGLIAAGIMLSVGRRNRSQLSVDAAVGLPYIVGGIALVMLAVPIVNMLA